MGGPAMQRELVVGVAFDVLGGAENVGYCVPLPVIEHFLKDIKINGKYTGFPRNALGYPTTIISSCKCYCIHI